MNREGGQTPFTFTALRTQADIGATVTVPATSFQNTPNFVSVFPDVGARQRALLHLFRLVVRDTGAFDGVTVALRNGEITGAAVWHPPERAKLTFRRQLQALPNLMKAFAAAPVSFPRLARLGGELEKDTRLSHTCTFRRSG